MRNILITLISTFLPSLLLFNILVRNCVPPEKVVALYDELKSILSGYTHNICVAEHLKIGVDEFVKFMSAHAVVTMYSHSLRKCTNTVCCGQLQSPVENGMWDLVIQKQPTPHPGPLREEYFLKRCDVLKELGDNQSCLMTCLTCHLTGLLHKKTQTRNETLKLKELPRVRGHAKLILCLTSPPPFTYCLFWVKKYIFFYFIFYA